MASPHRHPVPFRSGKAAVRTLAASDAGRRAKMLMSDGLFWLMQRFDRDLTRASFYARTSLWLIRAGLAHKTLGPRLNERVDGRDSDWAVRPLGQSRAGCGALEQLIALGLNPQDTVADFGCGTLRVGRHLIDYLAPGRYWGLDVDDDLLGLARTMLGKERLRAKRPNIATIDRQSLAACAAAQPRFVIAIAVAIHVPPEDLDRFCRQVASLGGDDTVFYMTFSATTPSARTSGTCWSYAPEDFRRAFLRQLPDHEVTTQLVRAKGRFRGGSIYSAVLIASPCSPAFGGQQFDHDRREYS